MDDSSGIMGESQETLEHRQKILGEKQRALHQEWHTQVGMRRWHMQLGMNWLGLYGWYTQVGTQVSMQRVGIYRWHTHSHRV